MPMTLGTAATLTFGLMFTNHVGFCGSCNEVHPYAKLSFDTPIEQVDVGVRAFFNSQHRFGVLVGGEYRSLTTPWGFDAGVAFGYDTDFPAIPIGRVTYDLAENATLFASPVPTRISDMDLGEWSIIVGIDVEF